MTKKCALVLSVMCCAVMLHAQAVVAVRLFDMNEVENVKLMSREEFNELRAEISEENKVFRKALANVKKAWDKKRADAIKAGDKEFPKFPSGNFVRPRYFKEKTINGQEKANAWLAQNQGRINAMMSAHAAAMAQYNKSASGKLIQGYSGRDDKKAKKKAEKDEMKAAMIERMREEVATEMSSLLKYNRPIPVHHIYDPVAGASTQIAAQIKAQEKALEEYKKRKEAAEAAGAAE